MPGTANVLGRLPNNLRKVSSVSIEARVVKVVVDALVAPDVGPAVGVGYAAAPGDIFAVPVVGLRKRQPVHSCAYSFVHNICIK